MIKLTDGVTLDDVIAAAKNSAIMAFDGPLWPWEPPREHLIDGIVRAAVESTLYLLTDYFEDQVVG